jgi:hypothetical protein
MNRIQFLLTAFFVFFSGLVSAQSWREITTVEDVCKTMPEVMQNMVEQFNLDYPGLEKARQAANEGRLETACNEILIYYQNCSNAPHLRQNQPQQTSQTVAMADTTLLNVFIIQNVRGEVPWLDDGHRDWYYKGPNNDREWAWLSNRHSQINELLSVYFETGNPKYSKYIDEFLRDFIIKSMPYPAEKSSTSVWRGLEVAARAKVWSRIFYSLINSNELAPATRLLMLSSLPDHAHYNRYFHAGNNWLTMEISALATVATNFPEFKNSPEWLAYSIETMTESMKGQVYQDGTQTELTSHYHNVAMRNFVLFKEICDRANAELPEFFDKTIESMYSYIAHVVRPDGYRILNNDGDRGSDVELILEGAEKYHHPEWEYIVTNGETGVKPKDGPSYFYPWAGHLVSRSGFDKAAHWSFFDIGPWGSGHQHNDKLHISVAAYGRDFLVDAGRFAYTGEVAQKFRPYAKGTQGHNSVLIDGKGQMADIPVTDVPVSGNDFKITPGFDFARGSFDRYFDLEKVKHKRSLMYIRGEFWVVVDKMETEKPRTIQTLWHWHPDCDVQQETGGIVSTKNKRGNLKIIPVGKQDWKVTFVKGQENPEIQGWYSEEYNKFEPNTASIFSTEMNKDEAFVWLIYPFEKEALEIKSKVLSKTDREIVVEVKNPEKGRWEITVPLNESKNAEFRFFGEQDQ